MGLEGAVRLGLPQGARGHRGPRRARAHVPGDGRPHVRPRQGGQRGQPLRDRRRDRPGRLPPLDQHGLRRRAAAGRAARARSARTSTPGEGSARVVARDAALDRQGRRRHHRPALRRPGARRRRPASRPSAPSTRPRPPSAWPGPRWRAGSELDDILTAVARDLWVLMAELATEPDEPRQARRGPDARVRRRWCAAVEQVDRRHQRPLRAAQRVRRPGPGPHLGPPRRRPHRGAPGRAGRRCPCVADGLPRLPYLNRLSSLLWTLARWAEDEPAAHPHHADRPPPDPGGSRCPSPSSSPAPLPPTWPPSAVGAVAGQTEGGGLDWAHLAGLGLRGARRATSARCPAPTAAPRSWSASARPPRSTPTSLRSAAGLAGPRGQAVRRRSSVDLLGALADGADAAAARPRPIAEGLVLGGYQFSDLQVRPEAVGARAGSSLVGGGGKRTQAAIDRGLRARRGGVLGPRPRERAGRLAHPAEARQAGGGRGRRAPGFEVTVWDEKEIRKAEARRPPRREPRLRAAAAVPAPRVRARQGRAAPSRSSARASRSTRAACRSSRPTA